MSPPETDTHNSDSIDNDIESQGMNGWQGRGIQILAVVILAVLCTGAMVVFERRDLKEQVQTLQEMLAFQAREKDGAILDLTREHERVADLKKLLVEIDQNSEQLIQNLAALRVLSADAVTSARASVERRVRLDASPEAQRDAPSEILSPPVLGGEVGKVRPRQLAPEPRSIPDTKVDDAAPEAFNK